MPPLTRHEAVALLPERAELLNAMDKTAQSSSAKTIAQVLAIGVELIAVMKLLPHRHRRAWMRENLTYSVRSAQAYMRFARQEQGLPPARRAAIATTIPLLDIIDEQRTAKHKAIQKAAAQTTAEIDEELNDAELPGELFECDPTPDVGPAAEALSVKRARAQYPHGWDDDIDGCPDMTDEVVVALNDGAFLHTLELDIHRIRRTIEAKAAQPEFSYLMYQDTVQGLKEVARNLADARPRCPCPKCQQRGCDFCTPRGHGDQSAKPEGSKPLGWVDHWRWKRHVKDRDLATGKRKENRNDK